MRKTRLAIGAGTATAAVAAGVAVILAAANQFAGEHEPLSVEELADRQRNAIDEIARELADGGELVLERRASRSGRPAFAGPGLEGLDLPDTYIHERTMRVDGDGMVNDVSLEMRSTEGEILATTEREGGMLVTTTPDGFRHEREGTIVRRPVEETLTSVAVAELLGAQDLAVDSTSTLAGEASTVLRAQPTTEGGTTRQYFVEIAHDRPLIVRTAVYHVEDGERTLQSESTVLGVTADPDGG